MKTTIATGVMLLGLALAAGPVGARVDVKVDYDKTFDFARVKSWAWNDQKGDVKMARTQEDDPEAMRKIAEPVIVSAVSSEMAKRGMKQAPGAPLTVTYYLLLSINQSSQELGQFLPAVTQWGVPPYAPATQSLEMMNYGSLVLDMIAKDVIVWRGVANAKI